MSSESCEVVCSDVDRFLERRAASYPSQFDIVVCDPPKLADSNASVKAAAKKYIKLNSEVMLRVRPGGLLLTFSCSAAIVNQRVVETRSGSQSLPHSQYFTSLVQEAARVANKNAVVIRELNGGDDHPIHIANPQSKYLAGLLLRIS
ncbi:rlmI [Symbiodinium microadriaticum]|nr:rlmI [Symbiodinium microadriaticum]